MHIGFLTTEYPPLPCGGIGTSIQGLARALVAAGERVTVVGWGPVQEFEDCGVRVRILAHTRLPRVGWVLNRLRARRELNRLVATEELAAVEAPDWCGPSAGMRLHCPLVVRCHGSATYFAHLEGLPISRWLRATERFALRHADAVVAVSRYAAGLTSQLFGLERTVDVIPNGVDVQRFQAATAAETDPNLILYFGTLTRKKGVMDLPPVLNRIAAEHPAARLALAGRDNPDVKTGAASTWELMRAQFGPAALSRVTYGGMAPYDAMQALIRRAAVCVFPSYAEAFPMSWLEAMACAKPVVAYDTGWAREVVPPGLADGLVRPGDIAGFASRVLSVLRDPAAAVARGLAARQHVLETFRQETIAVRVREFYGTLRPR